MSGIVAGPHKIATSTVDFSSTALAATPTPAFSTEEAVDVSATSSIDQLVSSFDLSTTPSTGLDPVVQETDPSTSSLTSTAAQSTELAESQGPTSLDAEDTLSVDSEGVVIPTVPTSTASDSFTPSSTVVSTSTSAFTSLSASTPPESINTASALSSSASPSEQVPSTSTFFTVVGPPVTVDEAAGPTITAPDMQAFMNNSSPSIFDSNNRLFPLGIAAVSIGGLLAILLGWWIYITLSRRARRKRQNDIISFSPVTPYPFETKYNGRASYLDVESGGGAGAGRKVPSFYHARTTGVASTQPLEVQVDYVETMRAGPKADDGFDTFNCALYPVGTCPLEHEKRMREIQSKSTLQVDRPGSPVPSFQTGRLEELLQDRSGLGVANAAPVEPVQQRVGRALTPPKTRHRPPPLVFSPHIDSWTNSVRGFTPRRSNTVTTDSRSSASSIYVPERTSQMSEVRPKVRGEAV